METRIIALEEQVMFLERHLQQLDEQVRSLADDLIAARREIAATRAMGTERFERLLERLEGNSDDVPSAGDEDSEPPNSIG